MERNAKLATAVALFVAVASALVVIPTMDTADAESSEPVSIGSEGFLALASDGVVVLGQDYKFEEKIVISGELTVDLNGHDITTITTESGEHVYAFEVSTGGSLTIIDDSETPGTIESRGLMVREGGSLSLDGPTVIAIDANGAPVNNYGSFTMDSGTLLKDYDGSAGEVITFVAIINQGSASEATINGGSVGIDKSEITGSELYFYPLNNQGGTLTIHDVSLIGNGCTDMICNNQGGKVYVTPIDESDRISFDIASPFVINFDGTVTMESVDVTTDNYGVYNKDGTLTMTDCTVTASGDFGICAVYAKGGATLTGCELIGLNGAGGLFADGNGTEVSVIDCQISQSGDATTSMAYMSMGVAVGNGAVANVTDCSIVSENYGFYVFSSGGTFNIYGGTYFMIVSEPVFMDGTAGGSIPGAEFEVNVYGGIFAGDVSDYVSETKTAYDFQGISIVSEVVSEPVIVIDDVPFASMGDVADFVNATGGSMDATDDTLVLLDDFQVGGAKVTVPAGSDITIDLNGNDIVFDMVDVAGKLTLTDDSQIPGTVTSAGITVNGGTLTGDAVVTSATAGSIVQIVGSGTVDGITIDMSDVVGGAIEVYSGATGAVTVSDLTIVIEDETATVDRGIYINETAQGGSVVVSDIVFDFNGNDSSPVVVDIDSNSHVTVSDLTYIDCARPNKVLVNATSDVTIGSEGNIDISDASDVVLWDASGTDHVFTVAGEYVVNGRTVITSGGDVVVPEGAAMVVNAFIEIASGSTLEGIVHFGSDSKDALTMNDVVIGDAGLKLSLGSVTMSGSVESGSISVSGNGVVDGDFDLGASKLSIPEGSQLTVMRGVQLSGTEPVDVQGKVTVYGTVSAPVANSGEVYTIAGSGEVTGEVTGTEPVEKENEPLSIEFVPDMTWTVGETYRLSLGIHPVDAKITGIHGAEDWLTFEGHVLIGQPVEVGTYDIELTIGIYVDGELQSKQTDFTITVVEEPVEEPDVDDNPIDWRYVVIAVILAIMVIALLVRFV